MATSRADVYADDGTTRATKALQVYLPLASRVPADILELATNALVDLRHWCDSRGLDWPHVQVVVEQKYQGDRAGRPQPHATRVVAGCYNCELVGAACEDHQKEVPGR